jgi:hypothetical protein
VDGQVDGSEGQVEECVGGYMDLSPEEKMDGLIGGMGNV